MSRLSSDETNRFIDLSIALEGENNIKNIINFLFDTLFNGTYTQNRGQYIKQPKVLPIIISYLPSCDLLLKTTIISQIIQITENYRNCDICCEYELISLLLKLLPSFDDSLLYDKTIRLITILGRHHITAIDVEMVLSCLKYYYFQRNSHRFNLLLKALTDMTNHSNPQSMFYFTSSKKSALRIPPFDISEYGYSISFWMRIEFLNPKAQEQRIFTALNDQGDGFIFNLTIKDSKGYLFVSHHHNGNVTNYLFENGSLIKNEWYHITFVHTSKMFRRSEMKLFINGSHSESQYITYFDSKKSITKCCFGSDPYIHFTHIKSSTTVYGQFGYILLCNESLSNERVMEIYKLQTENHRKITEILQSSLVFFYHPSLYNDQFCFNLVEGMPSSRVGGIRISKTMNVRDAVYRSGGVLQFIPFFYLISESKEGYNGFIDIKQKLNEFQTNFIMQNEAIQVNTSFNVIPYLFRFISSMIHGHESNQNILYENKGIQILSHIFSHYIDKSAFNDQLLIEYDQLSIAIHSLNNVNLMKDFYENLMLNFAEWLRRNDSFSIKKQYLSMIMTFVLNFPLFFRKHFGIECFITCLYEYLNYNDKLETSHTLMNMEQNLQPFNKQIKTLRELVFDIIHGMTNSVLNGNEFGIIFSYIFDRISYFYDIMDTLKFIFKLFKDDPKVNFQSLQSVGGLKLFYGLIEHDNEDIRTYVLEIITYIINRTLNQSAKDQFIKESLCPLVKSSLRLYPFTRKTYISAMNLIIDENMDINDLHPGIPIKSPYALDIVFEIFELCDFDLKKEIIDNLIVLLIPSKSHGNENSLLFYHHKSWMKSFSNVLFQCFNCINIKKCENTESLVNIIESLISIIGELFHQMLISNKDGWKAIWIFEQTLMISLEENIQTIENKAYIKLFQRFSIKIKKNIYKYLLSVITMDVSQYHKVGNSSTTSMGSVAASVSKIWENISPLYLMLEDFIFYSPYDQKKLVIKESDDISQTKKHIRSHLHRSESKSTVIKKKNQDDGSVLEQEVKHWVDFELCHQALELFDLLLKKPYIDWILRVDLKKLFERNNHGFLFIIVQFILVFLNEGQIIYYSSSNDNKRSDDSHVEEELKNLCNKITNFDSYTLDRLKMFLNERKQRISKDKDVDVISQYEKNINRLLTIITELDKYYNESNQSLSETFLSLSIQGTARVYNFPFQVNDIYHYCLINLFMLHKKDLDNGITSIDSIILDGIRSIIKKITQISLANVNNQQKNIFYEYQDEWEDDKLMDFVNNIFTNKDEKIYKVLSKSKALIESCLLSSISKLLEKRKKEYETLRINDKKVNEDMLFTLKNEFHSISQKLYFMYIRTGMNIKRKNTMENILNSRYFERLLRQLSNTNGVWRGSLVEEKKSSKGEYYIKLDKRIQCNNIRKKLKRNYGGKDHRKSTFTYLREMWAKQKKKIKKNVLKMNELISSSEPKELRKEGDISDTNDVQDVSKASIEQKDETNVSVQEKTDDQTDDDIKEFELIDINIDDEHLFGIDESVLFHSKCELITPELCIFGHIEITKEKILFKIDTKRNRPNKGPSEALNEGNIPSKEASYQKWIYKMFGSKLRDREWKIEDITRIFSRRYLLNWTALEIFFKNRRAYFFNLPKDQNQKMFNIIVNLKPPCLTESFFGHASEFFKRRQEYTEKWKRREMSNFDYLMKLNEISGRTFNDLTQYPVFPWIISNYTSETLDLSDRSNFRDLSKPIGCLDESRLKKFIDRYESLLDDTVPPFHYGSHYSSAGGVLFYLIRLEPFTSQFICLQGGKFDYPDRQFLSIHDAWQNCLRSTTDVKELIPEFFFFPDFLKNQNGLDLGKRSDTNEVIDDVILPPWAKTPEDFIRIHRDALESDYVSQNLHHWIDLIFGYKQRGKHAIESYNTFYYLTYEGSIYVDDNLSPMMKQSILSQIENFGQTPSQLLTTPHPERDPPKDISEFFRSSLLTHESFFSHTLQLKKQLPYSSEFFIFHSNNKIITINYYGEYLIHKYDIKLHPREGEIPFNFEMDSNFSESSSLSSSKLKTDNDVQEKIMLKQLSTKMKNGNKRIPFFDLNECNIKRFHVNRDESNVVLSFGHWDGSVRLLKFDDLNSNSTLKTSQIIYPHHLPVTCIDLSDVYLITGSNDTTASLWECGYKKKERKEGFYIKKLLYTISCHYSPINAVAISNEWDTIVTCSIDGMMAIHHLSSERNETRILLNHKCAIKVVKISKDGDIITYCGQTNTIYRYTINGQLIALKNLYEESEDMDKITQFVITNNGKFIITGGGNRVIVRRLHDLNIVYEYQEVSCNIVDLTLDHEERILFVSLEDGTMIFYCKQDGSKLLF